jgi:hypothetical protein
MCDRDQPAPMVPPDRSASQMVVPLTLKPPVSADNVGHGDRGGMLDHHRA